jgi:hypothetical protein
MDKQQFPPDAPACDWEQFCRELPGMLDQLHALAEAQQRLEGRLAAMDRRDESMATIMAALHQNQLALHGQLSTHSRQLRHLVDGMDSLGMTPSGFVGLARDVRGSFGLTRRFVKWVLLPLGAAAGAVAALWGLFHLSAGKAAEPTPPVIAEPAPRGDE